MYLLDANAFMEASRLYYSFDIAPPYWDWLVSKHNEGKIASIVAVKDEIIAGEGQLVDWATDQRMNSFWLAPSADTVKEMRKLSTWANAPSSNFKSAAIEEFMDSADLQLAAHAAAIGGVVVTRETADPNCRKRVKLPDAGIQVGVRSIQPFEMYKRLGLRFK